MSNFKTLVSASVLLALHGSPSLAQTANDVVCSKCVDTSDLAKQSVGTGKIQADAVTKNKIKDGAVTTTKIKDGSVTAAKLAPGIGGGDPQHQLVDGDGNPLGNVTFIESARSVWGIVDLFGRPELINVTLQGKAGTTGRNEFGGNLKLVNLEYESDNCSGNAYVNPFFEGLTLSMLAFLQTDPVFAIEDIAGTSWTEIIVDLNNSTPVDYLSYQTRYQGDCLVRSSPLATDGLPVVGFGLLQSVPVQPILVEVKP